MKRVYFYICLTAFLFGTMEVALKVAGGGMDSFQLTFLRFLIGGIFLLPFAVSQVKKNNIKIEGSDMLWLLLLGTICIPISMLSFQFGVVNSNAATAAVLFSINPLITMVLAHFFADERINGAKIVAFFIGLLGIAFMIRPWNIQDGNTVFGMCCTLFAALTFSVYTIMGKKTIKKFGIITQTSFSFIFGSTVLLAIILAMGKPVFQGVIDNWELVLYVGIFVTGIGYFSFFQGIKYSDATTGSVAFFIKPAIAPIFAVIVLKESLLWNTILGIMFILVASYINLRENRKRRIIND